MKEQKEQGRRGLSLLRIFIIVIAGAIFLYAAYQLFSYWKEDYASKQDRDQLARQAVTVLPTATAPKKQEASVEHLEETSPQEENTEPEFSLSDTIPLRVDFDALQAENPDIIAWIYCADTPINYPVAQSEDNQYYLRRLTDGSYNSSGTIFLDFRNSPDLHDVNSLIYGHNMTNGTMFGTLVEYKDQAYYDEHPELWILTRECAYRIDLIAGLVTASDSDDYTIFETREELDAHLQDCVERSTFVSDFDLDTVERIVTLSTCSYEYNTARYVVIGNMLPIAYPAE